MSAISLVTTVSKATSILPALTSSKPFMLTLIATAILSNIPTAQASAGTYAKCFKACMDASGNVALVAFPICAAACTVALPF